MKTLIFIVALAATLFGASNTMSAGNPESILPQKEITSMESQKKQDTLLVQGRCGMCKERIEKAAKSVNGVSSASWDVKTKELKLTFDSSKTSVEGVSKAIAKVGHDTEKDKAEDAVYNALPGCCAYR